MTDSTRPAKDAPGLDREDRVEVIPLGLRWIPDAFRVIAPPGGFAQRQVDMTRTKEALRLLREGGLRASYVHLIVRAVAIAVARHPELQQMVGGYRRLTPGSVDIGLSMAGATTYAPIVVLSAAERLPLRALIPAMNEAVTRARQKEQKDLASMRRTGRLVPIGFIRRWLLRLFQSSFWFRRKLAGTIQVSCLSSVDVVVPFSFYTGSVLGAGRVQDRVIAVDGHAVVRPTLWLTVCADHAAMDGRRAGNLLRAVKAVLEGDELVRDARDAVSSTEEREPQRRHPHARSSSPNMSP